MSKYEPILNFILATSLSWYKKSIRCLEIFLSHKKYFVGRNYNFLRVKGRYKQLNLLSERYDTFAYLNYSKKKYIKQDECSKLILI